MELPGIFDIYGESTMVNRAGFTLLELIMTMAITSFIVGAIYSAYSTQSRVQITQDSVTEMQQNIRAALGILTHDIRMAGYDPSDSAGSGFVNGTNFSNGSVNMAVSTNSTQIAFTADLDNDGAINTVAIDTNGDGSIDIGDMEQIAYKLNGTNLERYVTTSGIFYWQTVAEQIENIEFRYLDRDGNVTANFDNVKTVQIALLAKTERSDSRFINSLNYTTPGGAVWSGGNDNFRRRFLVTSIQCRNMGI